MHKVTIYLRYAYQSPTITGPAGLFPDHFKTIQHVNIHEIVFHNLYT